MRVLLLLGVLFAVISQIAVVKSDDMAGKAGDPIEGSYIVKVKANFSYEDVIKTLSDKFPSTKVTRRYSTVLNGFAADLPKEAVPFLEGLDAVEYVEQDQVMTIQPVGGVS